MIISSTLLGPSGFYKSLVSFDVYKEEAAKTKRLPPFFVALFLERIAVPCKAVPSEHRFWIKVKKTLFGCWEWMAFKNKNGYGWFFVSVGVSVLASRFSWELKHGPIPNGLCVLHKCDNPACVRPSHLFLGTKKDNTQDAVRKGRFPTGDKHYSKKHPEWVRRGEDHREAKLTEEKVREAKRLRRENPKLWTYKHLATKYGVTYLPMYKAVNGQTWRIPMKMPKLRLKIHATGTIKVLQELGKL